MRSLSAFAACLVATLAVAACAKAPEPRPAPPVASASSAASAASSEGGGWDGPRARARSLRQGIALVLPDAKAWTIDDQKTSWLVLGHPKTSTWIRLRVDRQEHAANRERCEADVRRLADLPPPTWGETVEEVEAVIPDWHSKARTAVLRDPKRPGHVTGRMTVFAARIRRCLAVEVVTDGPADLVGARLADAREIVHSISIDERSEPPREAPP